MRKREAAAVLILFSLIVSMWSGASAWPAAQAAPSIVLNYWTYPEAATGPGAITSSKVIAEFQASHPGVKINPVVLGVNDFDTKLFAAMSSGTGPDIAYMGDEPRELGVLVKDNYVLNLDAAFKQYGWAKRLLPAVQKRDAYFGHEWAVGNELETLGLMYNKKIFTRLGLQVPTRLDQLQAVMARIKSKAPGIVPMTLACGSGCYNGFHMMHALGYATIPTAEVLNTTPQGTGSYTDPAWLRMLTTFQSWARAGYFPANANGIGWNNHWSQFCNGKAAMLVQGTWLFSTISACEKANPSVFSFGFAPFPPKQGMPFQAYVGPGKAWWINAKVGSDPAKEKAALDFINMMISPAAAVSWIQNDQLFPGVAFDASRVHLTPQQQVALSIMKRAGSRGGPVDIGFNNSNAESTVWANDLEGILAGTVTPQKMVQDLEAVLKTSQAAWHSRS